MTKDRSIFWLDKYEIVGLVPGIIYQPQMGEIDLSKTDIPLNIMDKLYEAECPFIKVKVVLDIPTEPIY